MTEKPETIGSIPVTAPLWKGAIADNLHEIISLLSKASYHYADDSTGEWGEAREYVANAAALINKFKLPFRAIERLQSEKPQLVTLEQLIDAVLKDARK
jgi:hypothetical protein